MNEVSAAPLLLAHLSRAEIDRIRAALAEAGLLDPKAKRDAA